jgi:hypothetical protein
MASSIPRACCRGREWSAGAALWWLVGSTAGGWAIVSRGKCLRVFRAYHRDGKQLVPFQIARRGEWDIPPFHSIRAGRGTFRSQANCVSVLACISLVLILMVYTGV